jgi:hypothetical protein
MRIYLVLTPYTRFVQIKRLSLNTRYIKDGSREPKLLPTPKALGHTYRPLRKSRLEINHVDQLIWPWGRLNTATSMYNLT